MMTTCVAEIPFAILAQQQLRLTQFSVDHAADAIFWVAPDARIMYANEEAVRSHGYTREELLTMSIADIHPADPQYPHGTWEKGWQALRELGHLEVETVHRRKDGTVFPVWIHASYYQDGETELSFACCRDLTEKRSVELALREANEALELRVFKRTAELVASEARYQDLYHNAPDMFASIDAETNRVVQCNRTLADSLGYAMEELPGRPVEDLYDPACLADVRRARKLFASCGEVRGYELRLRCRDGQTRDVSVNMTAIRGANGQIVQRRCAYRDVSDVRRAEQQVERHRSELAHVARVATMGEMAAGLAHELNQPLYALHNFAEGALRRLEAGSLDQDSLLSVLRDMSHESQRAAEIIRSLRRYVSRREPQRAEVDVNGSVRRVARLISAECERRLTTMELELAAPLASVRCDGIQIEQVLMNLILNGMEAMVDTPPDDRRICVRSECVGRSAVRLSVSDCGPGLTPAEADRVFDAFYTTKADGLGLGLTISRTIVESHGGSLQVVPNVDGGLTVSFTLPISPTQLLA